MITSTRTITNPQTFLFWQVILKHYRTMTRLNPKHSKTKEKKIPWKRKDQKIFYPRMHMHEHGDRDRDSETDRQRQRQRNLHEPQGQWCLHKSVPVFLGQSFTVNENATHPPMALSNSLLQHYYKAAFWCNRFQHCRSGERKSLKLYPAFRIDCLTIIKSSNMNLYKKCFCILKSWSNLTLCMRWCLTILSQAKSFYNSLHGCPDVNVGVSREFHKPIV